MSTWVQWGVRYPEGEVLPYDDEQDAREHLFGGILVSREVTVTPWSSHV